jgi:3-phenylpropionate/trans-cinnamate dioxygenase ferredoxin reductase component
VWGSRGLEDTDKVLAAAVPGARVAVVGGGYIGMEAAACLSARGCAVTLLVRGDRPLARTPLPVAAADFLTGVWRARGVTVVTGAAVLLFEAAAAGERVGVVELEDRRRVACDAVVIGVGAKERVDLLDVPGGPRLAGPPGRRGVEVDERLRTSVDGVYAAGDVAAFPVRGGGVSGQG